MATTPTQNSVPSESPRDLKFNAGKIDEFVTSLVNTYVDRFGNEHYTIEGLRWLAQQAIVQYGWIPVGTFQAGATLTLPNQILKDTTDGEYYRWDGSFLPSGKIVPNGSTPGSTGGVGTGAWLSIGDSTLRSMLASSVGAAAIGSASGATAQDYFSSLDLNTVSSLMASRLPPQIKTVKTSGYDDVFGKRDIWVRSGETATPSQNPIQLNKLAVSDANGSVWYLDVSSGRITVESVGAKADGITDCWPYFELCLKSAEQGTNRVVTGIGINYLLNKPLILKTGRHLEFNAHLGVDIIYGGDVLTEQDAPAAQTPVGTNQTSVFSGKKSLVVVVHASQDYARYFSLKNVYIKCKPGVTADYGVYCPFGNQFDFSSVQYSDCLVGLDSRDLYTGSFTDVFFSAPSGVMGTVGFNLTPIENGRGAGTSLVFTRVGILNFRFSWYITELNYANFLSCYTEGPLSRYCARLERCNGIVFNAYGCERLTQVAGDGRLFVIIDSQTTINALQASYNVNLSGTQGISVTGNSQVTISEPYFVTVGSTYTPFQTDNTSRVRIFGFKWTGVTPGANVLGQQTVMYGEPGRTECASFPGNWNGGFIRIGSVRLWDDGTGLRIKRGSDPANVSDGTSL
ncbi:TPA: hypothetical protein ACF2WN_000248 [Escherichia coli]